MGRVMSDRQLVLELVSFFGARRAASILGYCVLFAVAGAKSRQDIIGTEVLSVETRYRVLQDIRRFHAAMVERGWEMYPDEPDPAWAVVRHLAAAA